LFFRWKLRAGGEGAVPPSITVGEAVVTATSSGFRDEVLTDL
jgi:hypothetical protein